MARTKEQNEKLVMITKKKIMDAGLKLFASKGFAFTSIKEIAEVAGISTGLIYCHYASKEELYCSLIFETVKELEKAIRNLNTHESPVQALADLTTELFNDISDNENLSCYFLLISRSTLEKEAIPQIAKLEEFRKTILELYDRVSKLIKEGQKLDKFKQEDPYKLTLLYFSTIQGIANMKFFMGEKFIVPNMQDVMSIILK